MPPYQDVLHSTPVLRGLTTSQMTQLGSVCVERQYEPGEFILREADHDPVVYVIVEGHAQLTKRTSFSDDRVPMVKFSTGDVLGELKIFDPQPNSASVMAVTHVTALEIDLTALANSAALADVRTTVFRNVGKIIAGRLRATTGQGADALQSELKHSRARAYAGRFIILMFAMIATFQIALAALDLVPLARRPPDSILSLMLITWTVFPVALSLRHTPFSLASYGLTMRNGGRIALQAFLWTAPILGLLLALKLALMRWAPSLVGPTVFDPSAVLIGRRTFDLNLYLWYALIYLVHAPLQEFVGRAALQGTLQHFTPVPAGRVNWKAIIVSNLLFSAAHCYFGFWFALAVFLPGVFWGWMFAKQKSIVGTMVSHIVMGLWGIFALGLTAMIVSYH